MMNIRLGLLCGATVAATLLHAPATSRADADAEREAVERKLWEVQQAIAEGKSSGDKAAYQFKEDAATCLEAIERGKRAGMQPTDTLEGKDGKYLFKRAPAVCQEYATWKKLVDAAVVIEKAASYHTTAKAVDPGDVKPDWIAGYRKFGTDCIAEVEKHVAAGVATDVEVVVNHKAETIPAATRTWCQGLVDWADQFSAATDKHNAAEEAERKARQAEARARWTKHKLTGDRLATFVEHDGDAWYVNRGGFCSEVTSGPALKKAKVLYRWLSSGDWSHTLVRYDFRGDKLARTSERYFDTRGKASAGCR